MSKSDVVKEANLFKRKSERAFPEYTLEEVMEHNSRTDCWVAIRGKVYDLTNWIPHHPGTDVAIYSVAG